MYFIIWRSIHTYKGSEDDEVDGRLEHEEAEGGGQPVDGHERGDEQRHENAPHAPAHAEPHAQHQHHVVAAVNHDHCEHTYPEVIEGIICGVSSKFNYGLGTATGK